MSVKEWPMTEAEWYSCTDPQKILEFLQRKASDRKLRLFACACCRHLSASLQVDAGFRAVVIAEKYTDGDATVGELDAACRAAWDAASEAWRRSQAVVGDAARAAAAAANPDPVELPWAHRTAAWVAARYSATFRGVTSAFAVHVDVVAATSRSAEERVQAGFLRDIAGNPFRIVTVDSNWLGWHDVTVSNLAQAIYDERELPSGHLDNSTMAVLADALVDAGCHDEDILKHCREPADHVRGCWVVDLLLAKE
jgi:hypothetical protein